MCITASARLFRFATLIGVLTWTVSAFAQVSTYYIDEDTNYENGNKCDVVSGGPLFGPSRHVVVRDADATGWQLVT
jgi:hypothetical protein